VAHKVLHRPQIAGVQVSQRASRVPAISDPITEFNDRKDWIDNRPFLRCMHGFGLCRGRLRRFEEAGNIFNRMLWLNPSDNQGVRFLIDDVAAKVAWEDSKNRKLSLEPKQRNRVLLTRSMAPR
jgi:hypothetical protein